MRSMIPGEKWPSLVIQGMLLGANIWFVVEHGSDLNRWIFVSILSLLALFSLQTTSLGFLYLYPVRNGKPTVGYDTWILRVIIMVACFCLYMGILDEYPKWSDAWLIVPGVIFILVIPIIFNAGLSDSLRKRAVIKEHKNKTSTDPAPIGGESLSIEHQVDVLNDIQKKLDDIYGKLETIEKNSSQQWGYSIGFGAVAVGTGLVTSGVALSELGLVIAGVICLLLGLFLMIWYGGQLQKCHRGCTTDRSEDKSDQ